MNACLTKPLRSTCALLMAAGCLTLAPVDARAHVILQPVTLVDLGAPSTFGFSFAAPIVGFTGMVQVTTSVIGVFSEGGLRDGASLTPSLASLVTGGVIDSSFVSHVVNNVGGAASFTGAGGTAGAFQSGSGAASDFGAPSAFTFTFAQPILPVSGPVTSQSNFGAAVMDFFGDGASVTGNTPAGKISTFGVNGATHTELGANFSATGLAGSELDSGVATLCSSGFCNSLETGFSFSLSGGGDGAVFLGRQEIGGDPITGTVMQLYALATQTNVFDCSIAGCDFSQMTLAFTGSGGSDSYGFIMRQEIIDFVPAVPEPGTIALVGLGLAGWLATRRRSTLGVIK